MTEKKFCKIFTEHTGEPIDSLDQIKAYAFNGRTLKDFVEDIMESQRPPTYRPIQWPSDLNDKELKELKNTFYRVYGKARKPSPPSPPKPRTIVSPPSSAVNRSNTNTTRIRKAGITTLIGLVLLIIICFIEILFNIKSLYVGALIAWSMTNLIHLRHFSDNTGKCSQCNEMIES